MKNVIFNCTETIHFNLKYVTKFILLIYTISHAYIFKSLVNCHRSSYIEGKEKVLMQKLF